MSHNCMDEKPSIYTAKTFTCSCGKQYQLAGVHPGDYWEELEKPYCHVEVTNQRVCTRKADCPVHLQQGVCPGAAIACWKPPANQEVDREIRRQYLLMLCDKPWERLGWAERADLLKVCFEGLFGGTLNDIAKSILIENWPLCSRSAMCMHRRCHDAFMKEAQMLALLNQPIKPL